MSCDVLEYRDLSRFHQQYYLRNRPVILRGLPAAYPGLKVFDWSAAHFGRVLGETRVPVIRTDTGFVSYERDVSDMPYREFYARSFGPEREAGVHYYFKNGTAILPEGQDDSLKIRELAPYLSRAVMKNLWMSSTGITVGLHFDAAENLNLQLRGHKIFTLYAPGIRGFYPMPMLSQTAHISRVFRDSPKPDLAQFPRFDPASAVRVELREGDVIYVPAYWWHQVDSLGEENVNLNFWWLPAARKQLLHPNQAARGYAQLLLRWLKFGNFVSAPGRARRKAAPA